MVNVSITFDDTEVQKMLRKMPPAIRTAIERFLIKAGLVIKSSAKANAPVRTGRLRDSISSKVDKLRQEAVIGPNVEYDIYQEFGTKYMKAQPYMRPALEDNVDNIRDIFVREIDLVIKRL